MKNLIYVLSFLGILFATSTHAQKYTRIGIMAYEMPEMPVTPEGVNFESQWMVRPIFFENERRVLKYFTLGSEINFSRYGIDSEVYGASHRYRTTNLGLELQGKISIPIADIIEVYGQYGLGYTHSFIKNTSDIGDHRLEQSFGIGYFTQTMSVGGSIIFAESFGVFLEAGIMKSRSVKTVGEIYDDSIEGADYNMPKVDLGDLGDDHTEGSAGFVKIGLVFQIGSRP